MTKEQKDLLLKDLSARLPYGTMVYAQNAVDWYESEICTQVLSDVINEDYIVKPYLFPLSSMTEEQKKEYYHIVNYLSSDDTETWMEGEFIYVNTTQFIRLIHFYHRNHLDYRGLINGELALDASGLNIY